MATAADISVSYDLSPDFFRLWLDTGMNYSCGLWDRASTLEQAQIAKLDFVFGLAGVSHGGRVLDVGCGWGGAMSHLARTMEAETVGITLSHPQAREVERRRIPKSRVVVTDYREFNPDRLFESVISIGMMEHVAGPEDVRVGRQVDMYREYFARIRKMVSPGACFGLQTVIRQRLPRDRAALEDAAWTSNTIFPGKLAPRLEDIVRATTGLWDLLEIRFRRADYARTLAEWHTRLGQHEAEIRTAYGDSTYETYSRYLRIAQDAFVSGYQNLVQIGLRRW